MPFFLKATHPEAAAAQAATHFEKPAGNVVLTGIHVQTKQGARFTQCIGELYDLSDTPNYYVGIGLYRKIVPEVASFKTTLWRGRQYWPHNYELALYLVTQVASEVLYYTVEYEIIEPKKKGWGE